MLVSVVIPLYNKAQTVKRAITSVLFQTYQEVEIVVVNDGSTDQGAEIVQSIKDPRILLVNQENAGVSAARNKGIEIARGEMIAFLDADDEWKPHFLETVVRLREKFSEAKAYATAYEVCYPSGKIFVPKFKGMPKDQEDFIIPNYFRAAIGWSPVWTSAVAVSKRIFTELGGFKVGEPSGEDLDMWGRIALRYPIAFSRKVSATYHFEFGGAKAHSLKARPPFVETVLCMKDDLHFPSRDVLFLREYLNHISLMWARNMIICGRDTMGARRLLKEIQPKGVKVRLLKTKWYLATYLPSFFFRIGFKIKNINKLTGSSLVRSFIQFKTRNKL